VVSGEFLCGLPPRRAEKLRFSGRLSKTQRGYAVVFVEKRRHSRRKVYDSPAKHSFAARREEFILEVKVGFPF
jgi:hypothetical protein